MSNEVTKAAELLAEQGISATVVRLLSANRFDAKALAEAVSGGHVVVIEEACEGSGVKERLAWALREQGVTAKVHGIDLGPDFSPHGDQGSLYRQAGLDHGSIANFVREVCGNEE